MKINNKGFTFVEILAVIVLIGVLSSIAIVGVTRYRDKAKDKDYEALAKSSYNAMEEYMMAHPYSKTVSLESLENGSFLSNRKDPATKNTDCTGSVEVNKSSGTGGKLDDGTFTVYLCCTNYKKKYTYPGGTVENYTGTDKCSAEAEPEPEVPTPPPGETKYTITYNLDGGKISGNPTEYSASILPITLRNPTKSGYTFTGWTGSNGTTAQTTVTIPKGTTGNKTYTAHWKANTAASYTITLNNNGATAAGTKSVSIKVGAAKLPSITIPKKVVTITYVNNVGATVSGGEKSKSYTLNGWYTTASEGSKVASNAATPVLYANVKGYTDSNGTWSRKENTTLYAQWAPVKATLPKVTKTGTVCRWKSNDGGMVESGGTWTFASANTKTFTATCTSTLYTVTLNGNGATTAGSASAKVSVGDSSLPTITKPKKEIKITYSNTAGATISGGDSSKSYPLSGWYTAASGGSKVASETTSPALQKSVSGYTDAKGLWAKAGNATLYAHWGNVNVTLPTITKLGYVCSWTTNNGTSTAASGGTWTFTSELSRTFTTKCTPKKVEVTFDCNGGKITGTSNTTATSNYTVGVAGNKFNKTCTHPNSNYKQDGWKFAGDTGKRYETANGISDSWINSYSPKVTLKAHWVPSGKPTCSLKITNNPASGGGWYRGNVEVTMSTTGVVDSKGLATSQNSTNGKTVLTVTSEGTTTVYGYVKNSLGTGACSKTVHIDKTAPTCGTASGSSTSWTGSNRTITQRCSDSHSGCVSASTSVAYSTTTKTANITIYDKAGNAKACPVNVYVDKTAPTCGTASGSSTSWTKNNRTVTQACSDAHSGCSSASTAVVYSTTTKTANITIRDKVGNSKSCPVNVYVDKTAPTCGSVGGSSTTWTASNRTITQNCSDAHSGCSSSSTSASYSSTTKTANITIKDNVGNSASCAVNVYVDKTAPTITGASKSDGNYKLSATIGDAHSGLKSYTWQGYSATSVTGSSKSISKSTGSSDGNVTLTVTDQVGNSNSYKFTGVYKYCSSTVAKDSFSLYHWYGMSKHCGKSNPYRKYDFKQYDCDCKMDKKDTSHFCSRSTKETTIANHGSYTSIIYYKKNNDHAVAACKGNSGTYANGYVREVCSSNNYFSGDSSWLYHGYKFYRGSVTTSEGYVNFSGNCWTYWGKKVLASSLSANDACTQACKNKFG